MHKKGLMLLFAATLLVGCQQIKTQENSGEKQQAAEIRLTLGMAYLAMNDLPSARLNIERALSYAPKDYRTHLAMALYLQNTHENALAEASYQHALRLAPDNGNVLNNYGAFLCQLGQYEAAQRYFGDIEQSGSLDDIANSSEYAGYCFLLSGQQVEAQEKLERALKMAPEKGERLLKTSAQFIQQQKYADALMLLKVFEQVRPANAESTWMQIQIAASENRLDDVDRYGKQLAQDFSQSKQYRLFLAHEY